MRLVEEAERKERPVESITMPYAPVARSLLRIGWCSDCYTVDFLSAPPILAVCPAVCYAVEVCPHPGRPRSGCAAGPFAPRGSHGVWKSTGTAMGAYRTRLHRGSGSPLTRSASACPGSAAHGMRPWPDARLIGAMSAARRARPAARTLRTAVRAAAPRGSTARTRSAVQGGRRTRPARRTEPMTATDPAAPTPSVFSQVVLSRMCIRN